MGSRLMMLIGQARWDPDWWPSSGESMPLEMLAWLALAAAGVVGLRLAWVMGRMMWARSASLRLYFAIGGRLGLSLGQRWMLWRIARAERLSSPLTLLMSRSTLRQHAGHYLERRPGLRTTGGQRRVDSIGFKLFGDE